MIDSNETIMYEYGRDSGYSDGYESAMRIVKENLDEWVCTGQYSNGKDYKYIPYEYYEEIMNKVIDCTWF